MLSGHRYLWNINNQIDQGRRDDQTAADGNVPPLRPEVVRQNDVASQPADPHEEAGQGGEGEEEALFVVPLGLNDEGRQRKLKYQA